jgi:hypothetical protein
MFHDGTHLNAFLISIYLWAETHKHPPPWGMGQMYSTDQFSSRILGAGFRSILVRLLPCLSWDWSTVRIAVRCMLYIFVILMFYMHSLLTIPIFSHMNNFIYGMRIFCKTIFISAVYISTELTTPSYKEHTFCILFFPWLHHFKFAFFVFLHGTNDVG